MKLLTHQLLERMKDVDLSKVDKDLIPSDKVEENEKVVGVLPDHLKRLYVAIVMTRNEISQRCSEVHAHFQPTMVAGMKQSELSAEDRASLYRHIADHYWNNEMYDLLWVEITNEFPELAVRGINKGIREGWKVVFSNPLNEALHELISALQKFNGLAT